MREKERDISCLCDSLCCTSSIRVFFAVKLSSAKMDDCKLWVGGLEHALSASRLRAILPFSGGKICLYAESHLIENRRPPAHALQLFAGWVTSPCKTCQ